MSNRPDKLHTPTGQTTAVRPVCPVCPPPRSPAKELLAEFWKLEKDAEKMWEGLAGNA